MRNKTMTEKEMERIDDIVEPMVDHMISLMESIRRKLPCGGSTMYKRSPVRSIQSALSRLQEADALLTNIE